MDQILHDSLLQLFRERGDLVETEGAPPRLRSLTTGTRAVRSNLSKGKLRDLALAAGIPGPDSGEPGAWQDSDAERVLVVAFTDEGMDRHGTIFPVEGWTFDNYLRNPAVFLNHWGEIPIGTTLLIEEKRIKGNDGKKRRGYAAHILFSREELNPQAEVAYRNVVAGRLRGASHGFEPHDIRRAEAADAKKYGIPEGTPIISADLLEISVVTIGSNPNVGPGRAAALAEARAIAGFRTADGEALLDRAALERVYSPEVVAEAVPAPAATDAAPAVAKDVTWDELTRCAADVEKAVRKFTPAIADLEDVEGGASFAVGASRGTGTAADPFEALLRSLDADAASDPGDGEGTGTGDQDPEQKRTAEGSIEVNGTRYVSAGAAKVEARRKLLRDLAARCLAEAQSEDPADLHQLLRVPDDAMEPLLARIEALRGQVIEVRTMLAALDPKGSSAGRPLADALLGDDLLDGLREVEKAVTGGITG